MAPQTHETLASRLDWQWYQRDDRAVAAALAAGEEIDALYPLDAGGLLDGYWHYLDECGILKLMADQQVAAMQRKALPVFALSALYHLKTLMGIEAMDSLPALLFSDPVAMSVLGGNGELVARGLTQRAQHRRTQPAEGRTMDPDVLGDFVADWSAKEAEGFLNGAIANLAANGAYGRWVRVVMDGSHLHTTPCFEYTHKHWGGLKLLLLWDAFSGLPLAAKVVGKDTYEPAWTLSLLRQAERNLGEHSRIGEFVADRLYVNGKLLHALDQKDIVFTIRAKAGMAIREDALSMVAAGSGNRQRRGTKEDTVKVVGLEGLNTYDDYNDAEAARHKNRKDYEAQPLNAVVVLASPQMPQDGEPWVLLTNGSVKQPLATYDRYDDRSLIENLGFREGKQGWHLERPPQRNEGAYTTHVFLTLGVYACTTAYRTQCEREEQEAQRQGDAAMASRADDGRREDEERRPKEAIRHYRQRLARENRGKVWVLKDGVYGIYHLSELSVLTGIRVRSLPPEVGTRDDIFRRYGLEPPS